MIQLENQCLEKPRSTQLRSAIQTLLNFRFFIESDKIKKKLSQTLTQICIKDCSV